MKWETIASENGYRRMRVEADWSSIADDYEYIVSENEKARVPGFRLGKVPRPVIEQRLQKQILEDLSQRVAKRLLREALRDADVEPMGPVELTDISCSKKKPFQFTVSFLPMPDIELPDLGSLAVRDDSSDPRDIISQRLLELVSFNIPAELVRAEFGSDDSDRDKESAEWKAAVDRVRLMLILKRIARQEGIEVTEADMERRIKEKAIEFGLTPHALGAELEEGGGMERLKDMLLAESTLDYLVEKISVS